MTVLITCSECGWRGTTCYMGMQFDKKNRCMQCQPVKKKRKKKDKSFIKRSDIRFDDEIKDVND